MPKLSGPSFLKNARHRAPQSVKRVIFVSSLADSNMRREVAEAGGAALLSKPLTMAQLQQAIAALSAHAQQFVEDGAVAAGDRRLVRARPTVC